MPSLLRTVFFSDLFCSACAAPAPPFLLLLTSTNQLSVGLAHASADGGAGDAGGDVPDHAVGLNVLGMMLDIGGVYAALLQAACVLVVVGGLEASKYTVNSFCVAKVGCAFEPPCPACSCWPGQPRSAIAMPFACTVHTTRPC